MIHPHTRLVHIDNFMGYGVFATKKIPMGTIIYAVDPLDIRISPSDSVLSDRSMLEYIKKYAYVDDQGTHIVSWDIAKYMNHSCDSNTLSTGFDFEIAIRDIAVGEEITDDYSIFCGDVVLPCACGSKRCRGVIRSDDYESIADRWQNLCERALAELKSVPQPLMEHVDARTRRRLNAYFKSGRGHIAKKSTAGRKPRPARSRNVMAQRVSAERAIARARR